MNREDRLTVLLFIILMMVLVYTVIRDAITRGETIMEAYRMGLIDSGCVDECHIDSMVNEYKIK